MRVSKMGSKKYAQLNFKTTRLYLVLLSFLLYIGLFLLFHKSLGTWSGFFIVLPLFTLASLHGIKWGLFIGILAVPVNNLFWYLLADPGYAFHAGKIPAGLACVLAGGLFGHISDLTRHSMEKNEMLQETQAELTHSIHEQERAEQELKQAYDELENRMEESTANLVKAKERLEREIEEHKEAEDALQGRNRQLDLLNQSSQVLNSSLDPDLVLANLLEEARRFMDVSGSSIWLKDTITRELVCRQAAGIQKNVVRGWRMPEGEGIAGWVSSRGEGVIVKDTRRDDRHFKGVDKKMGLEIRSILSVPVKGKNGLIGALQMEDTEVDRFDERLLLIMESLAATSAIAIENARLDRNIRDEIFERKQAERALQESGEKYRNIFNNAQVGIFRTRISDGKVLECNDRFARTYGYKTAEDCIDDFVVSEHYSDPGTREKMVASLMEKGEVNDREACFSRKNDDDVWIRFSARAYPEEGYLEGVGYEITKEKRAFDALRESEEKYRSLVESTEDSVYLLDRNCRYLFMNKKHLSRLDLQLHEVTEKTYAGLHSEKESKDFSLRVSNVLQTGKSVTYEYRSERDGGYFLRSLSPIRDSDRKVTFITVVSKDITKMKESEEALKKSERRLRFLSSQLIAAQENERKRISMELHDEMGQALTAININLTQIEKNLPSGLAPRIGEKLAETRSIVVQASDEISELSLNLRPSMLDDLGLLPTLRWHLNRYGKRMGMEINFEVVDMDERMDSNVETVLYRVVQEAFNNIAKHAEAKRVIVHLECKEEAIAVSVSDDGKGFDSNMIPTDDLEGGIGIIGMRERVSILGGSFRIQSRKGNGTQIFVEIPRH